MKVRTASNAPVRQQGITLVEILLVISLLVILVSFAMPSVGKATARAELSAATENVQYSIRTARNIARTTESAVRLDIESSAGDDTRNVSFARMRGHDSAWVREGQEYRMPAGIRMISDHDRYDIDSRGMVENPGRIILVSRADESISSVLEVN